MKSVHTVDGLCLDEADLGVTTVAVTGGAYVWVPDRSRAYYVGLGHGAY